MEQCEREGERESLCNERKRVYVLRERVKKECVWVCIVLKEKVK